MALVNGGFSHFTDMKKFLKNLVLRNCWSDFEIISHESDLTLADILIARLSPFNTTLTKTEYFH